MRRQSPARPAANGREPEPAGRLHHRRDSDSLDRQRSPHDQPPHHQTEPSHHATDRPAHRGPAGCDSGPAQCKISSKAQEEELGGSMWGLPALINPLPQASQSSTNISGLQQAPHISTICTRVPALSRTRPRSPTLTPTLSRPPSPAHPHTFARSPPQSHARPDTRSPAPARSQSPARSPTHVRPPSHSRTPAHKRSPALSNSRTSAPSPSHVRSLTHASLTHVPPALPHTRPLSRTPSRYDGLSSAGPGDPGLGSHTLACSQ